jgi:hypothetical protein
MSATDSAEAAYALPVADAAQQAAAGVPAMLAFLTQQPYGSESGSPPTQRTMAEAAQERSVASITGGE